MTQASQPARSTGASPVSVATATSPPTILLHGRVDGLVPYTQAEQLIVVPDDLHESMLHSKWIETFDKMGVFFKRFVWEKQRAATQN